MVLADPTAGAGLADAPVDVEVEQTIVEGALVVPTSALVALQEGGFAVELIDGGLVGVTAGESADGWVEVSGDLAEGQQVVVAR